MNIQSQNRRTFLKQSGATLTGVTALGAYPSSVHSRDKKIKLVLVGTGIRGITFWGKTLLEQYSDRVEFVGLCDINPGRVEFAKNYMGTRCPTFTDFEKMVDITQPDMVIVTTVDSTHHEYIIKSMEMGLDVLTEKPLTTDEKKCQDILNTENKTGKPINIKDLTSLYPMVKTPLDRLNFIDK